MFQNSNISCDMYLINAPLLTFKTRVHVILCCIHFTSEHRSLRWVFLWDLGPIFIELVLWLCALYVYNLFWQILLVWFDCRKENVLFDMGFTVLDSAAWEHGLHPSWSESTQGNAMCLCQAWRTTLLCLRTKRLVNSSVLNKSYNFNKKKKKQTYKSPILQGTNSRLCLREHLKIRLVRIYFLNMRGSHFLTFGSDMEFYMTILSCLLHL